MYISEKKCQNVLRFLSGAFPASQLAVFFKIQKKTAILGMYNGAVLGRLGSIMRGASQRTVGFCPYSLDFTTLERNTLKSISKRTLYGSA